MWATIAALVVLNSAGAAADPATGEVYGARHGLPGEFAAGVAPAATLLGVTRLAIPSLMVELEGTAVA